METVIGSIIVLGIMLAVFGLVSSYMIGNKRYSMTIISLFKQRAVFTQAEAKENESVQYAKGVEAHKWDVTANHRGARY